MEHNELNFDIDTYAARYRGRAKIQRLRFIAQSCHSLRSDALRLAILEAKQGRDTLQYKLLIRLAHDLHGEHFQIDHNWVSENDRWAAQQKDNLQLDLDKHKKQQNKEMMRNVHRNLGDFFHERGNLQQARGEHIKTRDYCTRPEHTVYMCYKVIQVSIEDSDFGHVGSHYLMADGTPDVDKNSHYICNMRACAGLANMVKAQYSQAVRRFVETNTNPAESHVAELSTHFREMLALEDVAIYGGLCALATMDREQLIKSVIDNKPFTNLLELVPDMREIILDFHNSRFTRCLQTMDKIKPELMLDIHLHEHVEILFRMIRRRAIVQYTTPFTSVLLRRMELVFNSTAETLEEELLSLIETGAIDARIDSENHQLLSKKVRPRTDAITKALQRGRDAFNEAEAMLLRMTLLKNNLQISNSSSAVITIGARSGSINSGDNIFERGFRHG